MDDKFLIAHSVIENFKGKVSKEAICEAIGVSKSGYYNWLGSLYSKEEKKKKTHDSEKLIYARLLAIIKSVGFVPGKRTFRTLLFRKYSMNISVKKIKKICLKYNLYPNLPKKDPYKGHASHDHPCTALDNFINQNFEIAPRCVILTDITYLHYGENKRTVGYLCCFKDAYTKEILGYSFGKSMTVALVKEAYKMMMDNHAHELKLNPEVYIHSDQGSQYLSTSFKQILSDDNFIQSCSNRGNSQDNAPMESFFARLKTAILSILDLCPDFETAQRLVYGYIETFNNTPQYNLAALSPKEFYIYTTTGVYPLDSYYGVKASELRSLSEVVEMELKEKYEARKAKRLESKKRREERAKLASAYDRCDKDEIMVNRCISKFKKTIEISNMQINKYKEILEGIKKGKLFIVNAVDSIKELLRIPSNWRLYPELDYVNQMKAMF